METYATSFLRLLRDIYEATRCRQQSKTSYQDLLRNIFEEGGLHDFASRWENPSPPLADDELQHMELKKEGRHNSASGRAAVRLRADDFLRKIFKKGGLHADPEVDFPILESGRVFGREQEKRELLLKCCNPDRGSIRFSAISIVGAAGIGKTTLARLISEDESVVKHFDKLVWVKVDGLEFTLHNAAQQILKSMWRMVGNVDDLYELDKFVRDTLKGLRCLIVFDGVESMTEEHWFHMNYKWFDSVDNGSKLMITTPSEGVANLVANEPFELKPLSQRDSWSLCRQLALVSSEDMSGPVVKNLEALCGCIPLLLKLVGSMMRYDVKLRHLLLKVPFSGSISLPIFDASVAILLCIWALPPQLRKFLALCSIFPKGYALNRETIINLWAALDLVKQSSEGNVHDVGNSYFHQLLCRSFFADVVKNEYGDIIEFKMPGLILTLMQDVGSIVWKEIMVIGRLREHSQKMETSDTLLQFLWDISEAIRHREQSKTYYKEMLRNFLKNKDTADADAEEDKQPTTFWREPELRKLLLKCCNPVDQLIQLSAIPIVGAGGIGKTSFARHIYENELVVKHFEMRVWVKVEGQEINLDHAARELLKSATDMACSSDNMDEMVRDTLLGRRCLIVFDGVESMTQVVWLHMNEYWFSFVDLGSIVLITTPSEDVAYLVSNKPIELKELLLDDGGSMYKYKYGTPTDLEALCGNIPLLLKLVGSMMRYDDKLSHLLSGVLDSDAILPTFDASVAILLCVWALPPQLRQCLAFCAIFPKGYALDRVKIINLWAAHGLLKPFRGKKPCDIGDSYFHQLFRRSFFTDIARNEYGEITDFRMPGMMHTIMQDIAGIVWEGKVGVIASISEDAGQLSMHSEEPVDVRTLMLSSTIYSCGSSLDHSLLDFQELQSLDLSCSGIWYLSDHICALKELKYLNLSYTLIETLPDSFAELSWLQTLDLSWCSHFKVLPKEIRNMAYMNHLDLSQCESLSHLPPGIGLLISLTTMPLFVLGKEQDCARLGELRLLNELRGRLDIKNLENVVEISDALEAELNKKKKLYHLGLCWNENVDNCSEVLEVLEPNQQLKHLDITGYMGSKFPHWILSVTSLTSISITDCGCVELPSLGRLCHLKELQLKGMTNIQNIGPEFYGDGGSDAFPVLENFGLYDMPTLLQWSGAKGSGRVCRSLKTLTVEGCPWLANIPSLINLRDLIVCNSNDEILSSLNQTGFGSLSSLLIKDMGLGTFFKNSSRWPSLKKLILFNSTFYSNVLHLEMMGFTGLEHLGILNCPKIREISLSDTISIPKLHVVDCPILERIYFSKGAANLIELVVNGCRELYYLNTIYKLSSLTKLIIRGSDQFGWDGDFKELEKLQYLYISECPQLERKLKMEPSLVSHIPCVHLGNRKRRF